MDELENLSTEETSSFLPSNEQKMKFEQILKKAQSFELSPIIQRFMNKRGVTRARAIEIADEMLVYLSLCATEPNEQWTITGEVDEMWHTFILFTDRYEKFCNEIAGSFIHHYPSEDNLLNEHSDIEITKSIILENLPLLENSEKEKLSTGNENFSELFKGNPAIVCKPINNSVDKGSSIDSYENTLKKYFGYLGITPKKSIWPSPGVLGRPDTPKNCDGGSGSGPICNCQIRTDPNPPKKRIQNDAILKQTKGI